MTVDSQLSETSGLNPLFNTVAKLEYADLESDEIKQVNKAVLDTLGVTIAGWSTDVAVETREAFASDAHPDGVTVVGKGDRLPLNDAILVNATVGHALDFDDGSNATSGHPSVPMVAPLIAVSERRGHDLKDLTTGYVAGYETQCAIGSQILPSHYEAGWHATSTIGTFGAAAAVSNLIGLNANECRNALNMAASMAAGLKKNFGTDTKPLHAGKAARDGATAALLAEQGLTAHEHALDGEQGFFELFDGETDLSDDAIVVRDSPALIKHGINFKKYPSCTFTHASLDAAEHILQSKDVDLESVESVEVIISEGADDVLSYRYPENGTEAKFSVEYCIAAMLSDGAITVDTFKPERVGDGQKSDIISLVNVHVDSSLSYSSFQSTVEVELLDGTSLSKTVVSHQGSADNPLTMAELEDKYLECASMTLGKSQAKESLAWLSRWEPDAQVETYFDAIN